VSRRLVVLAAVAVLVGVGTTYGVERIHHHTSVVAPPPAAAVKTATVTRTDLHATDVVLGTLEYPPAQSIVVVRPGTYTALPAPGTIVQPGQPLVAVDDRPIPLLLGAVPAWRSLHLGVTDGPDVAELEEGLVALDFGHGLVPDRHFGSATAAAIRRWQRALGVPATGRLDLGDVVFLPTPVRVGTIHATIGQPVTAESPYEATATQEIVHVNLPAARQGLLAPGSSVTIDLSSGRHVAGTVASVGHVVSNATGGDAGSNGADGSGGGAATPTVPVTITLRDPGAGGGLDQVPVQVEIVTQNRPRVLAVPVTALLALAEGGYGVEVVASDGSHHIVAVTPGVYAGGMVELTGDPPPAGTVVVAAQ
jgi:peptidoglycan hydrolase-like protein with peptidoglycan-binding domain